MTELRGQVELAPEFPVLDTLRAVGALAVLTTHTSYQTGEYLGNGLGGALLARLDVGVAIFFVLSGFLLSRPYLARRALAMPPPPLVTYYEKRASRILPVYVVAVVVALLFVSENAGAGARQWFSTLFLVDTYRAKALPHGLTHMWSLSAEVAFYVVLPGLMAIAIGRVLRPRRVALFLVVLAAISIVWLTQAATLGNHVAGAPGLWLPAYLTWFAAGIAIALTHVRLQQGDVGWLGQRVVSLGTQPGVCWTLVAGLMLVAATPLAGPTVLEAPTMAETITKHVIYTVVGGLVVLSGVFTRPGAFASAMSWQPLRHLGHISYSIFCIHLALLSAAFAVSGVDVFTGQGLRIWFYTLVMTLVASELLYRLVEMPGIRLRTRLRRGESRATSTSTPETTATTR